MPLTSSACIDLGNVLISERQNDQLSERNDWKVSNEVEDFVANKFVLESKPIIIEDPKIINDNRIVKGSSPGIAVILKCLNIF